jgi:hypothetical protein
MTHNTLANIDRDVKPSYGFTSKVFLAGSILGMSLLGVNPAYAATFTYSGNTTGAPTWNRPNAGTPPTVLDSVTTAVPYNIFRFTVNVAGSYSFNSSSPYDNYGFLYQGSFNPTSPLTNVIIGNDDSSNILNTSLDYGFSTSLNTGTNYFLVSTGFRNGDFGAFTTTIDGLGSVSPVTASVPEPFTIIGTMVGGTAALRMRKKLKSANKL